MAGVDDDGGSDPYANLPSSTTTTPQLFTNEPPPYTVSERVAAPGVHRPKESTSSVVLPNNGAVDNGGGRITNTDVHITTCSHERLKDKSLSTAYFLGAGLGFLGVHHFYLGRPRFGVLYLLTFGLLGLGWLTDLCRMPMLVRRTNSRRRDPVTYFQGPADRDTFYAYLMWFPLGIIGVHHYYLRRWKWAVLYTFTAGLFGVGWIVDAFRIPSLTRDTNRRLAQERINTQTEGPRLKKLSTAYFMAIPPLGILGGHHYYLGRRGFGILYTLTGGLFLAGWLGDLCRLPCLVRRINRQLEHDFQKASDGQVVTPDRTKHLDDAYVLHAGPLGLLGAANFYLGRLPWAFAYFFTAGFFGIGWIVDFFRLRRNVKTANDDRAIRDQVRIQYGPNTQIIVVTDGRIVAGAELGASAPVILPAMSVPGAHPTPTPDQPPSYDSVVAEEAQGATGGDDTGHSLQLTTTTGVKRTSEDPYPLPSWERQAASVGAEFARKAALSEEGARNPAYKPSVSQEDHFYNVQELPIEKKDVY